jgi:hypothetical protein
MMRRLLTLTLAASLLAGCSLIERIVLDSLPDDVLSVISDAIMSGTDGNTLTTTIPSGTDVNFVVPPSFSDAGLVLSTGDAAIVVEVPSETDLDDALFEELASLLGTASTAQVASAVAPTNGAAQPSGLVFGSLRKVARLEGGLGIYRDLAGDFELTGLKFEVSPSTTEGEYFWLVFQASLGVGVGLFDGFLLPDEVETGFLPLFESVSDAYLAGSLPVPSVFTDPVVKRFTMVALCVKVPTSPSQCVARPYDPVSPTVSATDPVSATLRLPKERLGSVEAILGNSTTPDAVFLGVILGLTPVSTDAFAPAGPLTFRSIDWSVGNFRYD